MGNDLYVVTLQHEATCSIYVVQSAKASEAMPLALNAHVAHSLEAVFSVTCEPLTTQPEHATLVHASAPYPIRCHHGRFLAPDYPKVN